MKPSVDKKQEDIRQRYRKFERALLVMIDYLKKSDTPKAVLLQKAIQKSQNDRIELRMQKISRLLKSGEFSEAVEAQGALITQLDGLLKLLNRKERIDDVQRRRKFIEDVYRRAEQIAKGQKLESFKNQRGVGDAKDRAKAQAELEKQVRDLQAKISRHDGGGKPGGKPGGQPGGAPGGKPDGHQHDQTPGREDLEQARQAMERAVKQLNKARRAGAADDQDDAERKLRDLLEKLRKILKQLREEERELLLRDLESRVQAMLQMQKHVYAGTRKLGSKAKSAWTATDAEQARKLAGEEKTIALEAAKMLKLLKADGSSVAFPEVIREARTDMLEVERRLTKDDVGKDTQEIERDIIDALSEMAEALKKEIEQVGEGGHGPKPKDPPRKKPRDPSLVDKVAELKMLRSLQMRVNRRTRRLGNRIKSDQATEKDGDVVRRLKDLAKRQARIQKSAYDLATRRNQ